MTVIQHFELPVSQGPTVLPKTDTLIEPTFRLHCPACAKRLILPSNLASRNGSAPCPRCSTAISWVGNQELAEAWAIEEAPAPALQPSQSQPARSQLARSVEPQPTLVMHRSAQAMPQAMAGQPKTPPLPFPLPPPVTPPPVQPRPQRKTVRATSASASQQTQADARLQNSPVPAADATPTLQTHTPTNRSLPIGWIVALMVGSSVILGSISLVVVVLFLSTRLPPTHNSAAANADQQALTTTNQELERAKQSKLQLEEEIQQLKKESQSIQVDIDRLRKEVL